MNHEDYKEMLPLYSLGSVEHAEAMALIEHLPTCAECRAELDHWRDTTSTLAYAAGPAEPSPEVRSHILESVRSLNAQPVGTEAGIHGHQTDNIPKSKFEPSSNLVRLPERGWSFRQKILAIAASLAFLALGASLFSVWTRTQRLQAEVALLSHVLEESQRKLAGLEQDREILSSPTVAVAMLKGTPMAQKAQGKLMYDQRTGRAIFMASDMPPAPAGMAYQLWYIAGTHVMPGAVFSADASGRAMMHDQLAPEARDATVFAVTLEPASGVTSPTGQKYLLSPAT